MRIISKFRDYYDNVQGMGSDNTDVFLREEVSAKGEDVDVHAGLNELLEKIPCDISFSYNSGKYVEHYRIYPVIIGFCGKTTLLYRYESDRTVLHFYSEEELSAFIRDDLSKRYKHDDYFPRKLMGWERRWGNRGWRVGRHKFKQESVGEAFDEVNKLDLTNMFQQGKAPIFAIQHRELHRTGLGDKFDLIYNVPLAQFDFVKTIDPYTAFQEISMYRTGVLGTGENEMVNISDEHKRDSKGFDEHSFKKAPGQKKRGKKK
ncbi:MAG: hypothetical protein JXR12_06020 [Neptunomonas phycophila]|uniref:hypothetical protein n=1 Tax=Neptunomonas phycophila TaxID=1572645 RepID=UPI003B8E01E4